jgi:hypothetical protein
MVTHLDSEIAIRPATTADAASVALGAAVSPAMAARTNPAEVIAAKYFRAPAVEVHAYLVAGAAPSAARAIREQGQRRDVDRHRHTALYAAGGGLRNRAIVPC